MLKNITKYVNCKLLSILSFGLIMLFLGGVTTYNSSVATSNTAEVNNITLYYITTRAPEDITKVIPLNPNYTSDARQGYVNDEYQNLNKLYEQQACKNGTIAVFVHGWEKSEKIVEERLNRVKLSLEKNNYTGPLIGFQLALRYGLAWSTVYS